MPYVKQNVRDRLNAPSSPESPGELNYVFTRIINRYINDVGESYLTYNDIIGALEACKLELYRRKVAPYEDLKMRENGDV